MNAFQYTTQLLTFLLICFLHQIGISQCNPDTTTPIAICEIDFTITPIAGEPIIIEALNLDDGSYDNCTSVTDLGFFISNDLTLSNPPASSSIIFAPGTIGEVIIALWVVDEAGLFNTCLVTITIEAGNTDCNPDTQGPIATCTADVNITTNPDDDIIIFPSLINEFSWDNCTTQENLEFFINENTTISDPPSTVEWVFPAGTTGTFPMSIWVVDEAGYFAQCWTEIHICLLYTSPSPRDS